MPAFELISYARQMLAPSSPREVLGYAGRAAEAVHDAAPAFVVHLAPGKGWQQSLQLEVNGTISTPSPKANSALFALYRRMSTARASLHLARAPEHEAIFTALSPEMSHLHVVPLRIRDGRFTGMLVSAAPTELSGQLELIAALAGPALEWSWRLAAARRDQERLLLFSETADEALWDWAVEAGEVWWGGGLETIFGRGRLPAKKEHWRDAWLEPAEASTVSASFNAARFSTSSAWSVEYVLRRVDGSLLEVLERAYFLREADGRAYRAVGTLRDISALKRAFESEKKARTQAEQASVVKDEFLAMLGHELRNPLAPILSSLELLERRAQGPDAQLAVLRRQAQHLVRLVDDLLDVSRISRGKIELVCRHLSISSLVLRAVEMSQPLITQREHRLELDVEEGLVVLADEARMAQVFANLLTNAAKYTPPRGKLELTARVEGDFVVTRVRDNGIGIAREMLPLIFDMFVQSRQAIDRASGGLGLGLTIVRNIVRLHGGAVEAHSEGPGRGSELVVRLPRARVPAEVATPVVTTASATRPRQLLIIDDNEDAAVTLGDLLTALGHSVQIVHHPTEALRFFANQPPEVALVDIGLPSMDGYELARRLRAQPGGDLTRLIALTGYGQASDRAKAKDAGFDAHLVKPVSPERLEALIASLYSTARGTS